MMEGRRYFDFVNCHVLALDQVYKNAGSGLHVVHRSGLQIFVDLDQNYIDDLDQGYVMPIV